MAKVSKKVVLFVIAALVLLTILLRYPLVEHERYQTDSYYIHYLSKSIVESGYAKWTFHPLSYLGYYPLSYPSGFPFLLAEFSALTGLSMELTILAVGMIMGILFCLGVFVLARQFIREPMVVVLATLLAILGSRFVDTTYWDGSARGPIVVLAILTVFALARASSTRQTALYVLGIFFGLSCLFLHHMAVMLVVFGIGYVLASFQSQFLLRRFRASRRRVAAVFSATMAVMIVVIAFGYFAFFEDFAFRDFQRTSLFDIEPPILSIVLNLAVSYANQVGLVLVLAVLGIPSLFRNHSLTTESLFLVTILVAFIPMLANSLYVSMLLAPFVAILGTIWIAKLYRDLGPRRLVTLTIVALVVASAALPVWSIERWNSREYIGGDSVVVDSQYFNDANYLTVDYDGEHAMASGVVLSLHLSALSGTHFMDSGISMAIGDDINSSDVQRNTTWGGARFPENIYNLFKYENEPRVDYYVLGLMVLGMDFLQGPTVMNVEAKDYFADHSKVLVVFDNRWPTNYLGDYSTLSNNLINELSDASWTSAYNHSATRDLDSYVTYRSERISLYLFEFP